MVDIPPEIKQHLYPSPEEREKIRQYHELQAFEHKKKRTAATAEEQKVELTRLAKIQKEKLDKQKETADKLAAVHALGLSPGLAAHEEDKGYIEKGLPPGAITEDGYLATLKEQAALQQGAVTGGRPPEYVPPEAQPSHDFTPADPFHGLDANAPERFMYSPVLLGKNSGSSKRDPGKEFYEPVEGGRNLDASRAMKMMQDAFYADSFDWNKDGEQLYLTSAGRTDAMQKELHPEMSQATRDSSTHRLGHGFDINLDSMGRESHKFKWLQENAKKFGFSWPAYPHKTAGKEWWHWEFTGKTPGTEIAKLAAAAAQDAKAKDRNDVDFIMNEARKTYAEASQVEQELTGDKFQSLTGIGDLAEAASAPLRTSIGERRANQIKIDDLRREFEREDVANKEAIAADELKLAETKAWQEGEMTKYTAEQHKKSEKMAKTRLEQADKLSLELSQTEIDPWRKWGFHDENGEFQMSNTARTVGGIVAVAANLILSIGSAFDKRPGQVPMMMWNMIQSSINKDINAQEKALTGKAKAVNELYTSASKWKTLFADNLLRRKALNTQMLKQIKTEIGLKKAQTKDANTKWAIENLEILIDQKEAEARIEFEKTNLDSMLKPLKIKKEIWAQGKSDKHAAANMYMNAWGLGAKDKKNKATDGLTSKQKELFLTAKAFKSTIREIRNIWTKYGKDKYIASKHMADVDWLKSWPGAGKTEAFKAMQRLYNIAQTNLVTLHKLSGDVGPVAVKEQQMAISKMPMQDDYQLGFFKIRRLEAYIEMLTNPSFYYLDKASMTNLINTVAAADGPSKQAELMSGFNRASGPVGAGSALPSLAGKELDVNKIDWKKAQGKEELPGAGPGVRR